MARSLDSIHSKMTNSDKNKDTIEAKQEINHDTDEFVTNCDSVVESFDQMDLDDDLLRGISAHGWRKPSDVQQRAIAPIISGRDTIVQAQSGRGKTGALAISCLQRVDLRNPLTQILILSPTHESARQTYNLLLGLSSHMTGLTCHLRLERKQQDRQAVANGRQIVVTTTGRAEDLVTTESLRLESLKMLVFDAADDILSRGWYQEIKTCFQHLPAEAQVAILSTTTDFEVRQLAKRFMTNPVRVLEQQDKLVFDGIKQYFVCAMETLDFKLETLLDMYESEMLSAKQQMIIFVNARRTGVWLADQLRKRDFSAKAIHRGLPQKERAIMMREFEDGRICTLIATEKMAREVDVSSVNLVINYDMPEHKEDYIYRLGRKPRCNRNGHRYVINFLIDATTADASFAIRQYLLSELENFYDTTIEELPFDFSTN